MSERTETARRFIDAFNSQDLDAFAATLHPDVEIHGGRGTRQGIEDASAWATKTPGGVQQVVVLEDMEESGLADGSGLVLALIRRIWHWDDDRSPAGEEEMAWLFTMAPGALVLSWRPFDDRRSGHAAMAARSSER